MRGAISAVGEREELPQLVREESVGQLVREGEGGALSATRRGWSN